MESVENYLEWKDSLMGAIFPWMLKTTKEVILSIHEHGELLLLCLIIQRTPVCEAVTTLTEHGLVLSMAIIS